MVELTCGAFCELLKGDVVKLIVAKKGESQHVVPKALICHKSTWFANSLVGETFKEGSEYVVRMPEASSTACATFVAWCYKDALPELDGKADLAQRHAWKESCIDLWMFADMYGILKLQNLAMVELCKIFTTPSILTIADVRYVYSKVPEDALLRKLLAAVLVCQLEGSSPTKTIADFDEFGSIPGFVTDIYVAFKTFVLFEHKPKSTIVKPGTGPKTMTSKAGAFMRLPTFRTSLMVSETFKEKSATGDAKTGKETGKERVYVDID